MASSLLLISWNYSTEEWNQFVITERKNKKEDNLYMAIGIIILGTVGIMVLRGGSFWISFAIATTIAFLIYGLRMLLSYQHLKKGVQHPKVDIYSDHLLFNNHKKVVLQGENRTIKSVKIIETKSGMNLLEFTVQWNTRKGPTHDEFRVLIPKNQKAAAETIRLKYDT